MQVDDGAKAAPEKFLNDGDDWLTIIEGSLHVIPQDHWGIGATIKVRLDGDNLIISADEPGYSESTSVRIPALTTRPEPAADAVERVHKAICGALVMMGYSPIEFVVDGTMTAMARAALQAAAVEPEPGLDELLDSVHPECLVKAHGKKGDSEHVVIIWHPDIDGNYYPEGYEWVGYGSGFTEAVAAAVRQATGTEGGE